MLSESYSAYFIVILPILSSLENFQIFMRNGPYRALEISSMSQEFLPKGKLYKM